MIGQTLFIDAMVAEEISPDFYFKNGMPNSAPLDIWNDFYHSFYVSPSNDYAEGPTKIKEALEKINEEFKGRTILATPGMEALLVTWTKAHYATVIDWNGFKMAIVEDHGTKQFCFHFKYVFIM